MSLDFSPILTRWPLVSTAFFTDKCFTQTMPFELSPIIKHKQYFLNFFNYLWSLLTYHFRSFCIIDSFNHLLILKNIDIVYLGMPYINEKSETQTPSLCSAMISFFTLNLALVVFLFYLRPLHALFVGNMIKLCLKYK